MAVQKKCSLGLDADVVEDVKVDVKAFSFLAILTNQTDS